MAHKLAPVAYGLHKKRSHAIPLMPLLQAIKETLIEALSWYAQRHVRAFDAESFKKTLARACHQANEEPFEENKQRLTRWSTLPRETLKPLLSYEKLADMAIALPKPMLAIYDHDHSGDFQRGGAPSTYQEFVPPVHGRFLFR